MYKNIKLSKNKSFEIQLDLCNSSLSNDLFLVNLAWTTKCDHAGLSFEFVFFKFVYFQMQVYDNRHWDYENNCWETYRNDEGC